MKNLNYKIFLQFFAEAFKFQSGHLCFTILLTTFCKYLSKFYIKRQTTNFERRINLQNITRLSGKKNRWQHIQEMHFAINLGLIKVLFAIQILMK